MTDPITREELLDQSLPGHSQVGRVEIHRITLEAGKATGRHPHPRPVVGYVLDGALRFQVAGEPETVLEAGEALYEPANTEIPVLIQELLATSERGYAIDDEETAVGMMCLGAPVREASGDAVAAVAVSLVKAAITRRDRTRVASEIQVLAGKISAGLGHAR